MRIRSGTGLAVAACAAGLAGCTNAEPPLDPSADPPNIVLIVADDLGYAELGSYGQTKIRTPNLDRLAAEGIRFTQHYSGSPVCAPSRDVLLTGLHTGHSYIRANDEMNERGDVWHDPALEGQRPILAGTYTIGHMLQEAGYVTGAIGKWGLGGPGSSGEPNAQGFDHWFGYLCQRIAHNYYPTHLWRNGQKELLDNEYFYPHQRMPEDADPYDLASYEPYSGADYSMDLMMEDALRFIGENRDQRFFLYLPFPVPHVSIQVPEESVAEYGDAFDDTPYLGERGYLPHPRPRAGYAAMITRMDAGIGRIMALLEELELDENTIVFFTSDNGPTFNGGTDSEFFESAGPLRGLKTELYEGGIRVPLIARWPGRIGPAGETGHVSAFWDFLPTLAELAGVQPPPDRDGTSMLPTLLGNSAQQPEHDYLYWEYVGRQAVRMGDWKAIRHGADQPIELYDLGTDIGEQHDVASENPDVVGRIEEIMRTGRTESELFPLVREDG